MGVGLWGKPWARLGGESYLGYNIGWGCAGLVCVGWALLGCVLVWSGLREAVLGLAMMREWGEGDGDEGGWAGQRWAGLGWVVLVSRHLGRGRLRVCVHATQKSYLVLLDVTLVHEV